MNRTLSWGILSTGRIAGYFAEDSKKASSAKVVAVASRDAAKARAFADKFGIQNFHGSYEALLADPSVEALYIATPHPQHAECTIRAAEAGKHVLCEKPLAMNRREAQRSVDACRANGVLLMEAFMYKCHPQLAKIAELVGGGALGTVYLIQATFSFQRAFDPNQRLWSKELGGGGIMDVGCYTTSISRFVAGAVSKKPFLDPVRVEGVGRLHPVTGVDELSTGTLVFDNGVIAQLSCSTGIDHGIYLRIFGSAGKLTVPVPYLGRREPDVAELILHKQGAAEPEVLRVPGPALYAAEADAFARALWAGEKDVPEMSVADSLGNMDTLDRWRAAIGLKYAAD